MEMKQILDSIQALQKLNSAELAINTAFKIHKNLNSIQEVLDIYQDKVNTLSNNMPESPSEEDMATLNNVIQGYVLENIDLELTTIPLSSLADVKLSAGELGSILWMLDTDA